jgi:hypothetical protein
LQRRALRAAADAEVVGRLSYSTEYDSSRSPH